MGIRLEILEILAYLSSLLNRRRLALGMGTLDCDFPRQKGNAWLQKRNAPLLADEWTSDPDHFLKAIGFEQYLDVDINDRARLQLDLSKDLPEKWLSSADLIVDNGTMEHVFDSARCLVSMNRLLSPGGIIFHCSPLSFYEHGFVNFNPKYFSKFYHLNGYRHVFSLFQVTIYNPLFLFAGPARFGFGSFSLRNPLKAWAAKQRILKRFFIGDYRDSGNAGLAKMENWCKYFNLPRNTLFICAWQKTDNTFDFEYPVDMWD